MGYPSCISTTADLMNDTVIQPRSAAHPLAGQRMSGADMIVQVLADEGVSAIFGYSGGAILPTYDAVFLYNQRKGVAGAVSYTHLEPTRLGMISYAVFC